MPSWRDLSERLSGKAPKGARRSSRWRKCRDELLQGNACACCGGKKSLIAHHRIPFHLAPDLELDTDNLIILCEAKRYGINCHLLLGHCGNWRRVNVYCDADVAYWKSKLKEIR